MLASGERGLGKLIAVTHSGMTTEEFETIVTSFGIHQAIGRRPIAAFGNSDGDFEMLEWVTSAPRPRFGLIVHHTDAEREWSYDRQSHIGTLARALDEAPAWGWTVVDMRRDWKRIYPNGASVSAGGSEVRPPAGQ